MLQQKNNSKTSKKKTISKPKYIFVVGGVMSGVGKGITSASLGLILQSRGYSVTNVKIDPYVNVDAGTMNPIEHGETFVLADGLECDQDMGNYERFLGKDLTSDNYMTTGKVYLSVIEQERNLKFGGKCVSVVPHIPNEVIATLKRAQQKNNADIVIIEVGGTVGEYENMLFLEAARMMKLSSPADVMIAMVSYLPVPYNVGEMKTKPTQHAHRSLNSAGLQADFIIARAQYPIDSVRRGKIAVMCNIAEDHIIAAPDVDSIYEVPINFEQDDLSTKILRQFGLKPKKRDLKEWAGFVDKMNKSKKEIRVGIVGKYFSTGDFVLSDSYISVIEAIKHAAYFYKVKPIIEWINSEEFEKDPKKLNDLKKLDAIIIPGGFGSRGIEGKILAAQFAREKKIPYLGLCYGMQIAVIEFARNILGLKDAHTTEINPNTKNPVIDLMEEQKEKLEQKNMGGSMRLGHYPCETKAGSLIRKLYGQKDILERHRHRYEFNNAYRKAVEDKGLMVSGVNPEKDLVEIVELKGHPFYVGTQFHPELQSKPLEPHPVFKGLIKSTLK